MPRLVRQRPLMERVRDMLNISDLLLWASEEIQTRELDSKESGLRFGLFANFTFLIARANSRAAVNVDDVFSDTPGNGWAYAAQTWVWILIAFSLGNGLWTFLASRHYRLFEASVDQKPRTPSAHRVRVQSSPASSSPLRFLADIVIPESAESRAHPDSTRDVWEIAVWDPWPACLQIFGYFSPLHVLLYMFELPLDPLSRRPSVTVFKCIVLQAGLSLLIHQLQSKNDQRQKDAAIIQKEVMHEYDTKYVHPRLHPVVRDVCTQVSMDDEDDNNDIVQYGTPTTLIRRGFQTKPNPNYVPHLGATDRTYSAPVYSAVNKRLSTPAAKTRHSDSFTATQQSVQPRQSLAPSRGGTPSYTTSGTSTAGNIPSSMTTGSTNFGGSMGVYTHAKSPLKKTTSMNDINNGEAGGFFSPRNSRELAAIEQREATERMHQRYRGASPLKERGAAPASGLRRSHAALEQPQQQQQQQQRYPLQSTQGGGGENPFANVRRPTNKFERERFPSLWQMN